MLVIYDDALQLLQIRYTSEKISLLGFNELALTPGLVEGGKIVNMDAFQTVFTGLFLQASPQAIKDRELFISVPSRLLFTFVEDFSHTSDKDANKNAILEKIEGHYPIPIGDLELIFDSVEMDHKISYAVYAFPKRWKERLEKVCKGLGISSLKFIPEPICQMALRPESGQGDFSLFSRYRGQIYLSLFHHGLLYDSYLVGRTTEDEVADCRREFDSAQQDFLTRFDVLAENVFFLGFEKGKQKKIRDFFEGLKGELYFLDGCKSTLTEFLPYEPDKFTLFGLFEFLHQDVSS